MRGKQRARIHTRRHDRDSGASRHRRGAERQSPRWLPSKEEADDLGGEAFAERFQAAQIDAFRS